MKLIKLVIKEIIYSLYSLIITIWDHFTETPTVPSIVLFQKRLVLLSIFIIFLIFLNNDIYALRALFILSVFLMVFFLYLNIKEIPLKQLLILSIIFISLITALFTVKFLLLIVSLFAGLTIIILYNEIE